MKKTKILCTIGPASEKTETLERMFKAGMNAIRINTAHGSIPSYDIIINNLRKVADLPIIIDIKGPEIRIQSSSDEMLKKGQLMTVSFNKKDERYFTRDFYKEVSVDDVIYLSDGLIRTKVVEKANKKLVLEVVVPGFLRENKGVNLPGVHLNFDLLTERDREMIAYAKKRKVDFIALSFARTADDVRNLRKHLEGTEIGIISKIENRECLEHIDEIIRESDGIMVARGDLGVEMPSEKLPIIQKNIIKKCNLAAKTVIVATEMLKSMIREPRPTRAETSDVANAILDGADGVMLSDETAVGAYPVESVDEMRRIAGEVESSVQGLPSSESFLDVDSSIANAIHNICERLHVSAVVTLTRSGYTANIISRYRLKKDIIAVTESEIVRKKLELVYGVKPIVYKTPRYRKIPYVAKHLLSLGLIRPEELVLFTAGMYTKKQHATNILQIHEVRALVEYTRK